MESKVVVKHLYRGISNQNIIINIIEKYDNRKEVFKNLNLKQFIENYKLILLYKNHLINCDDILSTYDLKWDERYLANDYTFPHFDDTETENNFYSKYSVDPSDDKLFNQSIGYMKCIIEIFEDKNISI